MELELAGALLDLVSALDALAEACISEQPGAGGRAAADLASPVNGPGRRGDRAARNVHEDIHFMVLAGLDHARTLAGVIRRDDRATVALATLARGCVEPLGRAFDVVTAPTAIELIERYSAIVFYDLEELNKIRPGESLSTRSGRVMTPGAMRDRIRAYLRENGRKVPPVRRSATSLTTTLLDLPDEGLEPGDARGAWSDMSSMAHGHQFAVTGFLPDPLPGRIELRSSATDKQEYSAIALIAMLRVGDAYLDYFAPSTTAAERWQAARERSRQRTAAARHLAASA